MLDLFMTLDYCAQELDGIGIPTAVGKIVHYAYLLIQVVVPILLIIWGMVDFTKAVVGGDEDEIKQGQKLFIRRLIAAVLVFLILTIVNLIINVVGSLQADDDQSGGAWECAQKMISDEQD